MLTEFKTQFQYTAQLFGCEFTTKNHGEYEDFAQNYEYSTASVNLVPVRRYSSERTVANTTRYKGEFELYFLKKFIQSDNYEDTKDAIIDEMIALSEAFQAELDKNEFMLFSSPLFAWRAEIIRQYTANLLCGVKVTVSFDTECNRLSTVEPDPNAEVIIQQNGENILTIIQAPGTSESYEIVPDLNPINVIVRYSNGAIAQTFENEPAGVNLDLTTGIFPPYEPELLAKIGYAEANAIPLPTTIDLAKENNFIFLQKQSGLWNKKDISYWLMGSGVLAWKGINVIDPNAGHNITWVGGIINTLEGIEGNAINAYGRTNFNASINGVNYQLNNAGIYTYLYKIAVSAQDIIMGTEVGNNTSFRSRTSSTNRINTSNNGAGITGLGAGYKALKRNTNNDFQLIQGTTNTERTALSTLVPNSSSYVLGIPNFGVYTDNGLSYYAEGAWLTYDEAMAERSNILASL